MPHRCFLLPPRPKITDAYMALLEGETGEYDPGPFWVKYNLFLAVWS